MIGRTPHRRTAQRVLLWLATLLLLPLPADAEGPDTWRSEFPLTDFTRSAIAFDEIVSDGQTCDSIPPIDSPYFVPVSKVEDIGPLEPVLSLGINGDFRAYPLCILLWHEIVNDVVGGVRVLVSYCPLCNSGVVFDRRLSGRVLQFGNTGRLRHFDMVMYDRQTESWWQQFLGEALIGELTGAQLDMVPARLESFERFRARAPTGKLLVPAEPRTRPYGPHAICRNGRRRRAARRLSLPVARWRAPPRPRRRGWDGGVDTRVVEAT